MTRKDFEVIAEILAMKKFTIEQEMALYSAVSDLSNLMKEYVVEYKPCIQFRQVLEESGREQKQIIN